ncbi:MAG TPA: NUDIX domain-containing protein [Terriglobales bacterium]|nr:NUDIX domain-containing protein [Terriglobales bacterium]
MATLRKARHALPFQVAAVCYRVNGRGVEFLLVNTNGGNKWTFPKGSPVAALSHSQSAEREAMEEAGVRGRIEPRHFSLYLHSKGVFWKPPGVTEYMVAAFLMEVEQTGYSCEPQRNPTWFSPAEAKDVLAKGREVKYARELHAVLEKALQHIRLQVNGASPGRPRPRTSPRP